MSFTALYSVLAPHLYFSKVILSKGANSDFFQCLLTEVWMRGWWTPVELQCQTFSL